MSEMVHNIITSETVLMEQYAKDRNRGQEVKGQSQLKLKHF